MNDFYKHLVAAGVFALVLLQAFVIALVVSVSDDMGGIPYRVRRLEERIKAMSDPPRPTEATPPVDRLGEY